MKKFRNRLLLKFTLPAFLVIVSWNLFAGWYIVKYQKKLSERELLNVANILASFIESDDFFSVSSGEKFDSENLEKEIKKVMGSIPSILSVHILERRDNNFYVIAGTHADRDSEPFLLSGSLYPAGAFPGALIGFAAPFVLKEKKFLIGYVPLRDDNGHAVALLRLKYVIDEGFKFIYLQMLGISLLLVMFFVFFGFFVSHQVSVPLHNILGGIESIHNGNLDYRLSVESDDEFGQIARAFNKMAGRLKVSMKILQDYLYRTIRSMVSIIEAKDPYTKGHSERVAFYSEKIARQMALPEKKINLLKDVALLHDIGKLGIEEKILHKTDRLTDEEWDIIKKHPLVGKEILKPVLFEKEGIDIIIQHHERFDGNGYPYKLAGNQINILAQILSVADAFDAMTSARPYRQGMSKTEAIEQLKENSGTQFNPEVVNAFLKVLEDEMHQGLSL